MNLYMTLYTLRERLMCESFPRPPMTNYNASRGFMYTSLPGADSTETTKLTADSVEAESTAIADD